MLDFNTQPYYDDFDPTKNYHRILFKPGVAVQARELTQSQTILQDQIKKFGEFVLKDGSIVTGGKYTIDNNAKSLKLQNVGSLQNDIEFFTGIYVVGQTSNCMGLVTSSDVLNFYLTIKPIINGATNFSSGETLSFFISKASAFAYVSNKNIQSDYTATLSADSSLLVVGCYGELNSQTFTINSPSVELGDIVTISGDPTQYVITSIGENSTFGVDKKIQTAYNNVTIQITKYAARTVLEVGVDKGSFFTNGVFVESLPQTLIPDQKTQYPSCIIGFDIIETVIDYVDDESLLDPSQGSYNYTAPGADRYQIYLQLTSKPIVVDGKQTTTTNNKFIELLRLKNGVVVSDNTDPMLGELENTLARQLYDHAGNFIVSPFKLSFHDANFTDQVASVQGEVSSGKAYVFGYEYNAAFPTSFTIDKARDTASVVGYDTSVYYGNSLTVSSIYGSLPNPATGPKLELHSVPKNTANANTVIGYAYLSNIDYVTTGEYSLYLTNITAPLSSIANVKSIIQTATSDYNAPAFSANTFSTNGITEIVDPTFNKLIYPLPYENIASLNNVNITLDKFDTLSVTSNTVAIHTGSSNIVFPSGTGILSTDVKNNHFVITTKATNGGYSAGQYVNLSNVTINVTQQSGEYVATLTFNNGYTGSIDIKYGLKYTDATQRTKTLISNKVSQVVCGVYPTDIGYSDISKFKGVFVSTDTNANLVSGANGTWNSGYSYNRSDVVLYGSSLYVSAKSGNVNNTPTASSPSWNLLRDVSSKYKLNNGQTEFMYDHGTVAALNTLDVGKVFVLFDYYTHSAGQYIAYNSYPTVYSQIPSTVINGSTYNLRDYIDFRPRRSDNATNYSFDYFNIPSTDFSGLTFDMSYYLGRIDKLVLTKTRKLQWLSGVPAYKKYVPPADLVNAMTIASIEFLPFTSSEKDIKITYAKHRRYTMDDIGNLDLRLQNVEYYTSLNLVEKGVLGTNILDQNGARMKNGFVVDPFVDFTVLDLNNNKRNISLDLSNQLARPSFSTNYQNISIKSLGTLYEKNGLVSFPYTEQAILTQLQATGTTNVNPFDVISYAGDLKLSPQSDVWVDSIRKPIININDDNAAAIRDASEIPGLLYNDWNSYYATHKFTLNNEKGVDVTYNNSNYNVTTATVVQSDTISLLEQNVIPYARSIPITFEATHLAPLTKMYVYVNGRMVNAYVKPLNNPVGYISSVYVDKPGTGYDSNSYINMVSIGTYINVASHIQTVGGTIDSVELTAAGLGYSSSEKIQNTIVGTGSNGSVTFSTIPNIASDLYTDATGACSGILYLPNDSLLSFPTGELLVTISDTPNYDFDDYSICKAQATFYSSGKQEILQETVTSIRQPYIKQVGTVIPPVPDSGCRVVVPAQTSYLTQHYAQPYSATKTGTITIPVYLNAAPLNSVTVTYLANASEDMSANSSVSVTPSSLTFNASNYSTPQNITIYYDLGNRVQTGNTYIDNQLPSYVEFYASSTDTRFNFAGGAKPVKSWLTSVVEDAVSYTELFPYKIFDPNQVLPTSTPYLTVSPIQTSNTAGKSFFTVTYGGGSEIGWWSDTTTTYPLTFTATSSNTNVISIQSSEFDDYDSQSLVAGSTLVVNKNDHQVLTFKYWLAANTPGVANVTVTTTSSNPNWNNLSAITSGTVTGALLTPNPAIVVHPNVTTSKSTGAVVGGTRYTTADGGTNAIGVSLSKKPNSNVTISTNTSNILEGIVMYKSEDDVTIVTGNTVTFTPNTWNVVKSLIVVGQQDYVNNGDINYNINLSSTSTDAAFNNLQANAAVTNKEVIVPVGEVVASVTGTSHTNGDGNTATVAVTLGKQPNQLVTVTSASSNTTLGGVITSPVVGGTANGTLYFNSSNWNLPQMVQVTGLPNMVGDIPYQIGFTSSTATLSEWTNHTTNVDLINDKYVYQTDIVAITDNSRSYSAQSKARPVASWAPAFQISSVAIASSSWVNSPSNASATITQISKDSITLNVQCYMARAYGYYSDHSYVASGATLVRVVLDRTQLDCMISSHATVNGASVIYTKTPGKLDFGVWIGNGGGTGYYSATITISGIYFDAISSGFAVNQTITSTVTATTVRLDTYAELGTTTSTTTNIQTVPWNLNAETRLVAYNAVKGYPLSTDPNEGFPVADAAAAVTSANTYRKDNIMAQINIQKKFVANIEAKIAEIGMSQRLENALLIESDKLTLLLVKIISI